MRETEREREKEGEKDLCQLGTLRYVILEVTSNIIIAHSPRILQRKKVTTQIERIREANLLIAVS
jgi:hypothetical protein